MVGAWQVWAPERSDAIAASLLVRAPRGQPICPRSSTVFGAVLEQESAARAALSEFVAGRRRGTCRRRNYAPGPYPEVKRYLAEYDVCSGERRPVEREAGHSYSPSRSSFGASFLPT